MIKKHLIDEIVYLPIWIECNLIFQFSYASPSGGLPATTRLGFTGISDIYQSEVKLIHK